MNLGAIYKKDRRDFKLGQYQEPVPYPKSFKQHIPIKRLYQNGWPSCGAHAGTTFKMVQEYLQKGSPEDYSSDYLWVEIKQRDGYPLDAGTTMQAIFKTLKESGVCDYNLLPYDYSLSLEAYSAPQRVTEAMKENAKPKGINSYAFSYTDLDSLKRAIYQNKAVILLIRCDDNFFGNKYPIFTTPKYGHFVVAVGYDENGIDIIDSTERDAEKADKFIANRFITSRFIVQAGTAIDLPDRYIFTNDIWYGAKGKDVEELQKRLGVEVTGYFGFQTFFALCKFQKKHGVPVIGFVVNNATRVALNTS